MLLSRTEASTRARTRHTRPHMPANCRRAMLLCRPLPTTVSYHSPDRGRLPKRTASCARKELINKQNSLL